MVGALEYILSLIPVLLMKHRGFVTSLAHSHTLGQWWGRSAVPDAESCAFSVTILSQLNSFLGVTYTNVVRGADSFIT